MESKKILLILIALLIYVNIYKPIAQENGELKQKIVSTKRAILKDELYLKNEKSLMDDLNRSLEQYDHYLDRRFYRMKKARIFNQMQKEIRKEIAACNIHEDNIKWGENYTTEDVIEFPMSLQAYGAIKDLGNFLEKIRKNPKMHLRSFTVSQGRYYYILRITLIGLRNRGKDV